VIDQIRVRIEGHVQGVFFRATTQEKARELGVRGWVANRRDGTVEAVFGGPPDRVGTMLLFCHEGPARADVERVISQASDEERLPEPFEIRR
jgi:acylphosphatase